MASHAYQITLSKPELQLIRDALEIVSPDSSKAIKRRDTLIAYFQTRLDAWRDD